MSISTSSLASKSNISKESRTLISMQSELILIAQIPYVPDLQLFLLISSQILINVHVYVIDVVKLLLREGCVDAVGHLGLSVFRWTGDLLAWWCSSRKATLRYHQIIDQLQYYPYCTSCSAGCCVAG